MGVQSFDIATALPQLDDDGRVSHEADHFSARARNRK